MSVTRFGLVAVGLAALAPPADAQWRPIQNLRARVNGTYTPPSTSAYGAVSGGYVDANGGYVPGLVSLRRGGTTASYAEYPNSPYTVPGRAQGFGSRIRSVASDGTFYNRYYNQDGGWRWSNWFGGPERFDRGYADYAQVGNRARWGYDGSPTRRIGGGGSTSRNSSAANLGRTQAMFNSIMANSNAQINAINARSSAYRQSSANNLSSFGDQIRSSMGGSGGGGARIVFDDNAPKRGR